MKQLMFRLILGLLIAGSAFSHAAAAPMQDESLVVQHADVPLYPGMAKVARISGTVQVAVTVRNGSVVNTEVLKSSAPVLMNAAIENLKTWRFLPQTNVKFTTTYVYRLRKEEAPFPENPRIQMQLPKLIEITVRPTKPTCMDCTTKNAPKPTAKKPIGAKRAEVAYRA
jgi:TonB family protein